MKYNVNDQPYNSNRFCLTATNGMVCSTSSLASSAGLEMLKKGGNAVDAAIATAAVLSVTEPTSNGIGGDAFAIVWMNQKMVGCNASGYTPKSINISEVKNKGYQTMPEKGWIPVTIPGQPKAWAALLERFGKLTLKEVLQPAIHYAENGYALSPTLSHLWDKYVSKNIDEYKKSSQFNEWIKTFTKNGEPYQFGEIVKLPNHAKTLRLIAESNAKEFYEGEIAKQIVKQCKRDGGYIEEDDLKEYDIEWVEPVSVNYHGYDIWEIPPNGQGLTALMTLNILKNFQFDKKDCTDTYHKQFEAMKMAFADAFDIITDPKNMKRDFHEYLNDDYGKIRSKEIRENAVLRNPVDPPKSGTVYLCAADKDGNMVSYIQSNYMEFGSGIVVEDYGIALQNRGSDFSLDENHINALAPRKKTYHTIIPGFITKDNKAVCAFGVMGGYMQPQGHVQVVTNLIDFNLNPQMALDAPRWQWKEGNEFIVEPEFDKEIIEELISKGHIVTVADNRYSFGRGQIILLRENGVYIGGTESRADSNIACY